MWGVNKMAAQTINARQQIKTENHLIALWIVESIWLCLFLSLLEITNRTKLKSRTKKSRRYENLLFGDRFSKLKLVLLWFASLKCWQVNHAISDKIVYFNENNCYVLLTLFSNFISLFFSCSLKFEHFQQYFCLFKFLAKYANLQSEIWYWFR